MFHTLIIWWLKHTEPTHSWQKGFTFQVLLESGCRINPKDWSGLLWQSPANRLRAQSGNHQFKNTPYREGNRSACTSMTRLTSVWTDIRRGYTSAVIALFSQLHGKVGPSKLELTARKVVSVLVIVKAVQTHTRMEEKQKFISLVNDYRDN